MKSDILLIFMTQVPSINNPCPSEVNLCIVFLKIFFTFTFQMYHLLIFMLLYYGLYLFFLKFL